MRAALSTRSFVVLSIVIIASAFLMRARVLEVGFTIDDYVQLSMMKGYFPVKRSPLDLFTFSTGEVAENNQLRAVGTFPWWSRADLRVSHFRPLSSALMWLDLALFDESAFAYHLHSALWWFAMMTIMTMVLRRLLPAWPALLALALCSAHSSHVMFLAWIANRNAVIASVFTLLGFWIQLRSHEPTSLRSRAASLVAFGLGLCAGEYAVGYLAYPACFELSRPRPIRQRLVALAPWCLLVALYWTVRTSLGFGVRGSGMYIDPLAEPRAFLQAAAVRLPVDIGDLVLGIQANWWRAGFPWAIRGAELGLWPLAWATKLENQQLLLVLCGAVAVVVASLVVLIVLRAEPGSECARNRWLLVAAALAILPSLSSVAESRLLLPSLLGWSIVIASCVRDAFSVAPARVARLTVRGLLVVLVACMLIVPPYQSADIIENFPAFAGKARDSILAPELDTLRGRRVLLLGAADATTTIYLPLVRRVHGRTAPRSCQLLTSTFSKQRLHRISTTTFLIERLQTNLDALDVYAAAFNRKPLQGGDSFSSGGMLVTIEDALEGRPIRTRYALDRSLDDPDLVLLVQGFSGLHPVNFPAIGESVVFDAPVLPFGYVNARRE